MVIAFSSVEDLERLASEQPRGTHVEYKPVDPDGSAPKWTVPGLHGLTMRSTDPNSDSRRTFAKKWATLVCSK